MYVLWTGWQTLPSVCMMQEQACVSSSAHQLMPEQAHFFASLACNQRQSVCDAESALQTAILSSSTPIDEVQLLPCGCSDCLSKLCACETLYMHQKDLQDDLTVNLAYLLTSCLLQK